MTTNSSRPLQPGDPAPGFALPAVNREGAVALDDYRGKSAVLVGLFRGLHCPFCRRHVAQLGLTSEKLSAEGVETLAIVNTQEARARQYFKYRPTRVLLAADPDVRTHRAFGLPRIGFVADDTSPSELHWPQRMTVAKFLTTRVDLVGLLPEPMELLAAGDFLDKQEGFQPTEVDQQIFEAHGAQLVGFFLIDRDGTIRWSFIEAPDRADQFASSPSDEEILRAARALAH
ncbi:MAG: redoxin domain-containing protein [Betaproteobacteria bacterium]